MNLVLVRHGQSEWNALNLFTGWKDPGLADQGRQEANQAGQLIHSLNLDFDVMFTSALVRAQLTGNIILNIGFFAQDQPSSRTSQGFMRGGRHEISMANRAWVHSRSHKPRNVRNISQHVGSDTLGDRAHARKIDDSGVGAGSHRDHFGTVLLSKCFELIVVNQFVLMAHTVMNHIKKFTGEIRLVAVRQVCTMA